MSNAYLNNIWHLLPVNDSEAHIEETKQHKIKLREGVYKTNILCHCNCDPQIKYEEDGVLVIHNSFDGREGIELANKILKKPE